MATSRLKVNGFDFSPFLRTQPDESPAADPAGSAYFRPQFSGAPALGDGASWVGDAVDNRTMVFPLYFAANNRAEIQAQIREADLALVKGAQVEFAIDPDVDPSSFFDLERGTVAEDFNFYHLINGIAGAVLTLTVRPYANTGTHRLIASIPAATSAVVKFEASGILGDAYSLANLEVRVGSAVASAGRVVAWGVHPHPSHNAYRAATSGLAQTGATVRGASGAIGSQYTAIPISPTAASGVAYQAFLDPPSAHVGRHRVIAIGRSALTVGIPLWAEDRFGAVLGATAIATQTDVNKWQVIDLGEINVPARASGQDTVPTQFVKIRGGGAAGAVINASPAFHLNGLMFLPLDYSAGILRTPGAAYGAVYADSFSHLNNYFQNLSNNRVTDSGQYWWTQIAGGAGMGPAIGTYAIGPFSETKRIVPVATQSGPNFLGPNASGLAALASGAALTDAIGTIKIGMTAPSGTATGQTPSAAVVFYTNGVTNASAIVGGVGAKLQFGPSQTLQIFGASSNGATAVLASAGIATTLASGLFLGQEHSLTVRIQSSRVDVWVATGALSASPALSASHALAGGAGWPVLGLNAGSNVASGVIYADSIYVAPITGASDIAPREWFRFESHVEPRVYQGNASVFQADRLANYRGQFPKMPPVPSNSTATAAARVVVLQGEVDNIQGLDGPDIALTVLEQFRFLRG